MLIFDIMHCEGSNVPKRDYRSNCDKIHFVRPEGDSGKNSSFDVTTLLKTLTIDTTLV